MSRSNVQSNQNTWRRITFAPISGSKVRALQNRWFGHVVTLLVVVGVSCGITKTAHAQAASPASWEVDLQAEGVTPTSQFKGSARFFAPARHRHRYAPQPEPYYSSAPAPEGYFLQEKPQKGLVWSGALLFGIPYMFGLTYAVVDDFPGRTGFLAIPVVGPWLARSDETDRATRVVLGLDGLIQASGAVLLTLGFTLTRKEWVPYNMGNVWVVPAATAKGQVGLIAGGNF